MAASCVTSWTGAAVVCTCVTRWGRCSSQVSVRCTLSPAGAGPAVAALGAEAGIRLIGALQRRGRRGHVLRVPQPYPATCARRPAGPVDHQVVLDPRLAQDL